MRDWKKAFGQPDDEFALRVQQTLLAIEEKEEKPVKKKMTLSFALACILCVTVLAAAALAASGMLGGQPDATLSPLSQGTNGGSTPAATVEPAATPMPPSPSDEALTVVPVTVVMAENGQSGSFHQSPDCGLAGENDLPMPVVEALSLGKKPCPDCCDGHIGEWVTMVDENGSAFYKRALDVYGGDWRDIIRNETVVVAFSGDGDREHYHAGDSCDALGEYASVMVRMTRQEALELGYMPCAECVGKTVEEQIDQTMPTSMPIVAFASPTPSPMPTEAFMSPTPSPMPTVAFASPMPSPMPTLEPMPTEADGLAYWTTAYGHYYHVDEHCSGMEGAQRVSFEIAANMGKQPCPVCVVTLYRGDMQAAQAAENEIGATPMPGNPQPYDLNETMVFLSGTGLAYHLDADCSFASGESVPLRDILACGYHACPYCVPTYGGATELNDGLSLMTDFNQPLRTGEPHGWGIDLTDPNADDFNAGSEPLNCEVNGNWSNDILTVHNLVFLRTRSAIFMEFEFSVNDAAISPWSIRVTPNAGEGPLGWHDARVHEVSGEDDTIHYLLSIVMDSPAGFPDVTNEWYVYGGNAADEHRLVGILGNVD